VACGHIDYRHLEANGSSLLEDSREQGVDLRSRHTTLAVADNDPEEVRGAGVRHGRRARVGGGVNSHPYPIEDEDKNRDKKEDKI